MFSIKFLFLSFAVTLSFSQNIDKNIILNPLMGKKIKLENYLSNGPVLINFWATWCAPCIKEMPYLDQFEKKYKDKGFSVLAVSVDNQKSLSQVRSFIKTKKFSFDDDPPIAFRLPSHISMAFSTFSIVSLSFAVV